jgi:hypothetical protein
MAAGGVSLAAPRISTAAPKSATRASKGLLDEIERRACRYFYDMADPDTGLVRDRATAEEDYAPSASSIAATGFGLSALAIADSRRYLQPGQALNRARLTLRFLCDRADQERGFFYHFLDSSSGKRIWKCELSSVDTAWLLCGVLHSNAYWDDPEIKKLSAELLDRTDWEWMLDDSNTLCHGWTPENGFLHYRWDTYSELMGMYLLAISSQTHPIPASSWNAFTRPKREYQGISFIDGGAPLFVHQYSHAWFDFRQRTDRYGDYFRNSALATEAHRLYCVSYQREFPWYGPDMWGVTASDSRSGYRIWCSNEVAPDGTLVPCASGGSLVFLPEECGAVLQNMVDRYGGRVWKKYGFIDAFHPKEKWYSRYTLGIDQGITLLMTANMRRGDVWSSVMSTPQARRAVEAVGLRPNPAG